MGLTQSSLEDENTTPIKDLTGIKFHLQDQQHSVKSDGIDPNTSLNAYLRQTLHMTGTKGMCYEGGCGACVVVLQNVDPITQKDVFLAVNSCLIPLLSCDGWRIYTIEGIGDPLTGYDRIQKVLAKFNGTQCGFCSPGMVMNMYALEKSGNFTMKQVENAFSGNICRCTGYRPILSAFKSLSIDADPTLLGACADIEDLRMCPKKTCPKEFEKIVPESFCLSLQKAKWVKVHTLRDLLGTLRVQYGVSYRLVAGNTAQGVYQLYKTPVDLYIDVTDVAELKTHEVQTDSCILGANMTLTETIEFFTQVAETNSNFAYLKLMADHIDLIANVPVRNRGTLAGNLMIKHDHHDFPSDIFLILETVGATLTIVNLYAQEINMSPLDFINYDMSYKVLKTITLRSLSNSVKFVSYKIMPRAQNAHAHVNAGFLIEHENYVVKSGCIVYGNLSPNFVHAANTEKLLVGKNILDNSDLQTVYKCLDDELKPESMPPEPSPQFRKQLAIALFYKAILSIAPSDKIAPKNKSGAFLLERPISNGAQDYETSESLYPLTQPITKIEALAQTSGQAEYIEDMPDSPSQLFGALVLAETLPNSVIKTIDASEALNHQDIVAFFSKADIPGENIYCYVQEPLTSGEEEIFCSGKVLYYEQPIGILVGTSQDAVEQATCLVKVTYDVPNVAPLLSVRQILKNGRTDRINEFKTVQPTRRGNDVKQVVKGSLDIYHQYHFHMETQCCNVIPNENGLDVYPATQWMDMNQICIAKMLNLTVSQVNLFVRRCGGSFGGKLVKSGLIACAAALASWKLRKPVKLRLPLTTNMSAIGKRMPFSMDYEVGINNNGVIQYLESSFYTDVGAVYNENVVLWLENIFKNNYTSDTFLLHMNRAFTDTQTNTWVRAPGSAEGLAAVETIMEHIASTLNMDPLDVRIANLINNAPIASYISDMKSWANIEQRKSDIVTFNKENRWKKKGLAVAIMSYDIFAVGPHFATVTIFQGDGSVQITHGGIEIGQGINTKAAQVCAYKFKIPVEKVTIAPSSTISSGNNLATGGSFASDGVCYAINRACDELLERIKPYQTEGIKWEEVIKTSYQNNVNLIATGQYSPNLPGVQNYNVYGICATEVLVDILTGQHLISRVDLIQDTGRSISPNIDIGQVEGAFVMGLGYYTTEKIVFDDKGKVLTNNTWTYYPPQAKDIPIDFRVKFPKNSPSPYAVLKSKGTGEPALSLAISVPFAIRNALASARTDASESNSRWYPTDGPADVENVFLNSLNDYTSYKL